VVRFKAQRGLAVIFDYFGFGADDFVDEPHVWGHIGGLLLLLVTGWVFPYMVYCSLIPLRMDVLQGC
jgi:hypothetical protein